MKSLHIALTADPYIPVPPKGYGGIERIIDLLVRGLIEKGHKVTLIAHPESRIEGTLIPYGISPHNGLVPRTKELLQVGSALWRHRSDFDLIHSFGRLAALLPVLPLRNLPKIQSYHRTSVPWRGVRVAVSLAGESICFTGCSNYVYRQRDQYGKSGGTWRTIYNGVTLTKYDYVSKVSYDAPLVFLGKLERNKGAHTAIAIAKASGRRLIIAGNRVSTRDDPSYFEQEIAPHIDDKEICYIGEVDDLQKNVLLGSAVAFLFPTYWEDEAFGLVMVEAMACGTPVIGFARGGVPEVIKGGVNGYLCKTTQDAIAAVENIGYISRAEVRADYEMRFSDAVAVNNAEMLYFEMIAKCRQLPRRPSGG